MEDIPSLRELIAELIEAGKSYVRAEIAYYKQLATGRARAAATGAAIAVVALLFVQAALTVLLGALGLWAARWLGMAGGFAIAGLVGLMVAALLGLWGANLLRRAGASS